MGSRYKKKQSGFLGVGAAADPDKIADFLFDEGLEMKKNEHLRDGLLNPGKFLTDKNDLIKAFTAGAKDMFKKFYDDMYKLTADRAESTRIAKALSTHVYNAYIAEVNKVYPSATASSIKVMTPIVKQ